MFASYVIAHDEIAPQLDAHHSSTRTAAMKGERGPDMHTADTTTPKHVPTPTVTTPPHVLFAPATWGLAETRRLLAIAAAGRGRFTASFVDYGGPFGHEIEAAGWPRTILAPRLDASRVTCLLDVDQRRRRADALFSTEEIAQRVAGERALLASRRPAAVVGGFSLAFAISARAEGVPLITPRPVTGTRYYYRAGYGRWPESAERPPWTWLSAPWRDACYSRHVARGRRFVRPSNIVARRHGVRPFRTMWDLFEGDRTLICDPPEAADLGALPSTVSIVGPIDVLSRAELEEHVLARHAGVVALDGDQKLLLAAGRAALPFVGVARNQEQAAQLDVLVTRGMALRVPQREADAARLLEAMKTVAAEPRYRRNAEAWRDVLARDDGAASAAAAIADAIMTPHSRRVVPATHHEEFARP